MKAAPLPFFRIKHKKGKTIVFFLVGRAKSGKSFLARFMAEVLRLDDSPRVLLVDCDEVADRDFSRWRSSRVRSMPLKNREDIAKLTGAMPAECQLVFADLAGASQGFMEAICSDHELLAQHGIEIVPIIVSTDIAELSALTLRWLHIFKSSERGFLILNQHETTSNAELLRNIPPAVESPADLSIMHVSPLDRNVALEIARLACSVSDVVDGEITTEQSDTLALSLYQTVTGLWANKTMTELDPLLSFIRSITDGADAEQTPSLQKNSQKNATAPKASLL